MKKRLFIRLKAAFLLIVFSLNTMIGFACAVGLDMGFNGPHHEEGRITKDHKDGHGHEHIKPHHHTSEKSKGNCCNNEATKFAKVDKLTPQSFDFGIHPVFFTAFLSTFYDFDVFLLNSHTPDNKLFVRTHHPPIPDIRIAIQSFQI